MRASVFIALLLLSLLAGGCGWAESMRVKHYHRYHDSRWGVLLRAAAEGPDKVEWPRRPEPPKIARDKVDADYEALHKSQQQMAQDWDKLRSEAQGSIGLIRELTTSLRSRDGEAVASATPELRTAIAGMDTAMSQWRASQSAFQGGVDTLQVDWLKAWPECDLGFDFEAALDDWLGKQWQSGIDAQAQAEGSGSGHDKSGAGDGDAARQTVLNQRIAALGAWQAARYEQLAAPLLTAPTVPAPPVPPVPPSAESLDAQLKPLGEMVAARAELDEAIQAELDRFEYVTGLSLEEVLELPAEDNWDPESKQARSEIQQRQKERSAEIKQKGGRKDKASDLPLSRRTVWQMLKEGRVPSLSGDKVKKLRGQRQEMVKVSLARLEFYRQLDQLLSRCIAVQQREVEQQWDRLWPQASVETDLFAYIETANAFADSKADAAAAGEAKRDPQDLP